MQTYHIETVVSEEGILNIKGLPFHKGEKVEVTVKSQSPADSLKEVYSLRGKPIRYKSPFGSVAENDWDILTITN